jgi:hypothetical protein
VYPSRPGLVIGFHGCDKSVRDAVVNNQTMLHVSRNGYDWLGKGMYFWEGNFQRALHFAQEQQKESIDLVIRAFESAKSLAGSLQATLPENYSFRPSNDRLIRQLDNLVIEHVHLHQKRRSPRPFDSVLAVFVEGKPLYPSAGFHEKTHIQLCIRNPNCIKGFFIPREKDPQRVLP